jgi:Uma2 family endonuclease
MDLGLSAPRAVTLPEQAAPSRHRMTVEEWVALPEDDTGELVDGLLVEEEMPDPQHEVAVVWLTSALRQWVRPFRGHVLGSELKLALGEHHGRKPDLSLFMPDRKGLVRRGPVRVPPDVCVEVVSSTPRDHRRDRVVKLDEYAAFGVPYYWLVDPDARTLEIFERRSDGLYTRVLGAEGGVQRAVPGCPGLTLDLDDLWAEIDELPLSEDAPAEAASPKRAAAPRTAARRAQRRVSPKKPAAKR